jgi:6-phosphofructokinase 1
MSKINRIGVFTSGGDAPGMNAAIRAVVRTASHYDLHVYAIKRGYDGMIDGDLKSLDPRAVGNIIHQGGTVLKTARSERFRHPEGRKSAYDTLRAFGIDACVAIGGDGTFTGAKIFTQEYDIPFIGIPGTIDNDLYGADYTIGFDTAVNTAVEAIDRIRDTADSHNRLFFVEVMGRHAGFIALNSGIAGGAASVLIPEEKDMTMEDLIDTLRLDFKRKKLFSIVVVAEGGPLGGASKVAAQVREQFDQYETKEAVIGYLQRGGSPSFRDRVLASQLGFAAVKGLLEGRKNVMTGIINHEIVYTPFEEAITRHTSPRADLMELAKILAQ